MDNVTLISDILSGKTLFHVGMKLDTKFGILEIQQIRAGLNGLTLEPKIEVFYTLTARSGALSGEWITLMNLIESLKFH